MSDHEQTVLMSVRVRDMTAQPVPGAIHGVCATCHEPVWLAPSSVEILRTMGLAVVVKCIHCAGPKPGDSIRIMPGQREEIVRAMQSPQSPHDDRSTQ